MHSTSCLAKEHQLPVLKSTVTTAFYERKYDYFMISRNRHTRYIASIYKYIHQMHYIWYFLLECSLNVLHAQDGADEWYLDTIKLFSQPPQ